MIPALILATAALAVGQLAAAPPRADRTDATPAPPDSEIAPVLGQLQAASQAISADLSRLRIEKWKADSSQKRQAQHDADSVSRNLSSALPAMMDQVRNDPRSLAAAFKLYRNVNALYDVFSGIVESVGAFGAKSEYESIVSDLSNLENIRRMLGDRLQEMASARDTELHALRTQLTAATAPTPPKKIVVEDEEKPKKPAKKRKKPPAPSAPAPAAGTTGTTPAPQP